MERLSRCEEPNTMLPLNCATNSLGSSHQGRFEYAAPSHLPEAVGRDRLRRERRLLWRWVRVRWRSRPAFEPEERCGGERSAQANDEYEESSGGTILHAVSEGTTSGDHRTRISPVVGPGSGARRLQANTDEALITSRPVAQLQMDLRREQDCMRGPDRIPACNVR